MSNNYVPCFNKIDFVVIPSYIELTWLLLPKTRTKYHFMYGMEKLELLFFSEFSFRANSCLIETSQLILACEFAFALQGF